MDPAIIAALITAIVSLLVAISGWIFAWRQHSSNEKERRQDQVLTVRQQKANRVLEQLDAYAELEDLYRLLANQHSWIVRDENNQFVRNADGTYKVERRVFESDPDLEQALNAIEGTENIKGAIALQIVRLHRKQSQSTDLLYDLDSSGKVGKSFDLLYTYTVTALDRALKSNDFFILLDALNNANSHRRTIRAYVNHLAKESSFDDVNLPPLPSIEQPSIKHIADEEAK